MPFAPKNLYTLSHVRYTPHHEWHDKKIKVDNQEYYEKSLEKVKTNFTNMMKDAARYIPSMRKIKYEGSLWEVKTVLPRSEYDDSRPILFKKDVGGVNNLYCVIGGKIDNIYDMDDELREVMENLSK